MTNQDSIGQDVVLLGYVPLWLLVACEYIIYSHKIAITLVLDHRDLLGAYWRSDTVP
jgi:hypothetical protein